MSLCYCRTAEGTFIFFSGKPCFLWYKKRFALARAAAETKMLQTRSASRRRILAFRVVKPGDRPIFIIFAIQIFTVVCQVALASILGVYHGYGFTEQIIPNYLLTYCRNFIMALPVQLFIAGPAARWLLRQIFVRGQRRDAVQV